NNLFVPNMLMIGIYHKVRIAYTHAAYLSRQFHTILHSLHSWANTCDDHSPMNKIETEIYGEFLSAPWRIELIKSSQLKANIRKCNRWKSSHLGIRKIDLLSANMPRYLWRVSIDNRNNGDTYTEFLLDATQIPQGKIMVGYISYCEKSVKFWSGINEEIQQSAIWDLICDNLESEGKSIITSFELAFTEPSRDNSLNILFGPPGYPNRDLKSGEADEFDNISRRPITHVINRDNKMDSLKFFDQSTKYIWVIDRYGKLIIGEDIEEKPKSGRLNYKGHPTLVDGAAARLGGELFFNNGWVINTRSKAYSAHMSAQPDNGNQFLKNVIAKFFTDLSITPYFFDPEGGNNP
ncbi:MAG: hypothetical protein KJ630_13305, partial [Proteobacteria bacterium]|nr:hypothetical protein [Pseudomonadota bacterium]